MRNWDRFNSSPVLLFSYPLIPSSASKSATISLTYRNKFISIFLSFVPCDFVWIMLSCEVVHNYFYFLLLTLTIGVTYILYGNIKYTICPYKNVNYYIKYFFHEFLSKIFHYIQYYLLFKNEIQVSYGWHSFDRKFYREKFTSIKLMKFLCNEYTHKN